MDTLTCILKYVIVGDSAVGKSSLLIRLTDDRFSESGTEPTLGVEFGSRILTVGDQGKRVKVQCWDTAGTESFRSITRSYFRGAAGALLVYDVTRRDSFQHVTSWLSDLREHADENVSIILVANKTDLCSSAPPPVPPTIQYGQAVSLISGDAVDTSSAASSSSTPEPATASPTEGRRKSKRKTSTPKVPSAEPAAPSEAGLKPRAVSTNEGALFAKQHGLLYVETSAKEGWGVVDAFEWTAREVLVSVSRQELERRKKASGVAIDKKAAEGGGKCC